jgi:hypothetical protein
MRCHVNPTSVIRRISRLSLSKRSLSTVIADNEEIPDIPDKPEGWRIRAKEQSEHLDGPWRPKKRVARSTMEEMRLLHEQMPEKYDIKALSARYHISFEAVRRILHSKFQPTPEIIARQEAKRHEQRRNYVRSLFNEQNKQATQQKETQSNNKETSNKDNKNATSTSNVATPDRLASTRLLTVLQKHQQEKPNAEKKQISEEEKELAKFLETQHPALSVRVGGHNLFQLWRAQPLYEGEPNWKKKIRVHKARAELEKRGLGEEEMRAVWERWVAWRDAKEEVKVASSDQPPPPPKKITPSGLTRPIFIEDFAKLETDDDDW